MGRSERKFRSESARSEALLSKRPTRPPDAELEGKVLRMLSAALADKPDQILTTLSEQTLILCGSGSAGVSLLQGEAEGDPKFYWPAISGAWARFVEGGMPRDASPCGHVINENASLLFVEPEDQFPAIRGVVPAIREVLLAPFHVAGRPVGTVWALAHDGDRPFDSEDRRRLESLAEFASTAFQSVINSRDPTPEAPSGVQSSAEVAERVRIEALLAYHLLDSPPEPEFDAIVQLASSICDAPVALVSLVQTDRQWFKAKVGFDACETPIGQSVCSFAIQEDEILIIPDLTKDTRTAGNELVTAPPNIRFYAGAVLRNSAGQALGALCVIDDKPRPGGLSETQRSNLILLARQTMALIELRRAVGLRDVVLVDQHKTATTVAERLRAAEARLQSAQNAAQAGAFEIDVETGTVHATGEFSRIFGLQHAERYEADALRSIVLPMDREIASTSERLHENAEPALAEYRIKRPNDGAVRWISRRGGFELGADGRNRFVGLVEDCTDRKLEQLRSTALLTLGDQLRDSATVEEAITIGTAVLGETLVAASATYVQVDAVACLFQVEGSWVAAEVEPLEGQYSFDRLPTTMAELMRGRAVEIPDTSTSDAFGSEAAAYVAMGAAAVIAVPLLERRALVGAVFVHTTEPRIWSEAEVVFVQSLADRVHVTVSKLRAEADQQIMNEELSHRMKNTMAVVQSIAKQTLRRTASPEAMQEFDLRLASLGSAHDVLLRHNGMAARIGSLIENALLVHGWAGRVDFTGPEIRLNAKVALSFAMLLHELLTNAVKYGALSNEEGRVAISWEIAGVGSSAEFLLHWAESGGPVVVEPTRRGFGSRLINAGLNGTRPPALSYATTGLAASFSAPLSAIIEI